MKYLNTSLHPHAITAEEIALALPKGKRVGTDKFEACCPAHDDTNPSLRITQSTEKVLVKCFSGCSQDKVIEALRDMGLWHPQDPTHVKTQENREKYEHSKMVLLMAEEDQEKGREHIPQDKIAIENAKALYDRLQPLLEPHLSEDLDNGVADGCGNSGLADPHVSIETPHAENLRIPCGNAATDSLNPLAQGKHRIDSSPLPLPDHLTLPEYPLDALGPILGKAAEAFAYYVQAPKGMAGQSVLAVAALLAQAHIQVQRGTVSVCPVSLYLLSIAESGDRKSSLDKMALKPIEDFEEKRIENQKGECTEYNAALGSWMLRKESIEKVAKKGTKSITSEEQAKLKDELFSLEAEKPQVPRFPNITIKDPTAEGIWRHFQHGEPSVGLFSDEGITFFDGHGMQQDTRGRMLGLLSQLWDGTTLKRTRANYNESGVMTGRRLSSHLMIQPVISSKILSDPLLMQQGFMARFLICHEFSIAGSRFLAGRDLTITPNIDPDVIRYYKKLEELLNLPINLEPATGALILKTMVIEGESLATWVTLHDGIEAQLAADGAFLDIKAFASKAAENAARIAAILAWVEECPAPTPDHINRAGILMSYYLQNMRMQAREAQQDKDAIAARNLLAWMQKHGGELTASNFNNLPVAFRRAKKARSLLDLLIEMGHVVVSATNSNGKHRGWRILKHD